MGCALLRNLSGHDEASMRAVDGLARGHGEWIRGRLSRNFGERAHIAAYQTARRQVAPPISPRKRFLLRVYSLWHALKQLFLTWWPEQAK